VIIEDIANWILTQSGIAWQLGVDFFIGYLPIKNVNGVETPVRCMVIAERTPGAADGRLPDRVDKAIQIWNRAKDYLEAGEDAREIYDLVHGGACLDLPPQESGRAWHVMTVDALGDPAPIAAPNARGFFEFSTNYIFRIEGEPPTP